MKRRLTRLGGGILTALLLSSIVTAGATATDRHHGKGMFRDILGAWLATARFHSLEQAEKAGYGLPPAPAPLHECIASFDGSGAMGYHYINGALLETTLDPRKPEALVYAPDRHGKLRLVALEYVVFKAAWDEAHPTKMPMLFGQAFMETRAPNRYEIPAFYALHVWLWKANPAGLFAPFNRRVSCGSSGSRVDGSAQVDGQALGRGANAAARFACATTQREVAAAS